MRVISTPAFVRRPVSVAAVERVDAGAARDRNAATHRQAAQNVRRGNGFQPSVIEPARVPRQFLQADAAAVGIGLTAQNLFHSHDGAPAEENLIRANDAYVRSDSIRFSPAPMSRRIA